MNMDSNLEFPSGLIFKLPREGAPDFVKGSLSIKRAELIEWLNGKSDEWVNLDLKVGQSGKAYASVNTFKPDSNKSNIPAPNMNQTVNDDLPF